MTLTAAATRSAPTLPAPAHPTLCAAFQATAAAQGDRIALRTPGDGLAVTWAGYAERVRATAARLAGLGVGRGDTVALLLANRPEAAWVDVAGMHLGAAGLSLYLAGTPAAHAYVLDDADVRVLVTERSLAGLVPGLRRACPKLEHVIAYRRRRAGRHRARRAPPAPGFDLEDAAAAVRPDDRLTLMYTSGTTGAPEGRRLHPSRAAGRVRGLRQRGARDGLAARGRVHPVRARRAAGDGPLPLAAARLDDDVLPRPRGSYRR